MTRRILLSLAAAALVSAASVQAQVYTEVGDAGQTLATAQNTGLTAGNPLMTIFGTISSATDADLFRITITAPTTFSASTVNGSTMIDTALFLFNSSGAPIYTNDDASGATLQSMLPAGSSFTMSLAPGVYYLAISLSGNEPINSNGQRLFAAFPSGDTTAVRGAAGGINPTTLANFDGQTAFSETGAYMITLTSAATVPEPSTVALALAGATGLLVVRKRRQAKANV